MIWEFYKNKKVFVTGHTGFKGSWLCKVLSEAGAEVTGFALEPPTNPSLFKISGIENSINSIAGDVRNYDELKKAFDDAQPEIVFHLAAQPLVLESYRNPVYTYETNVMGTVNLLECVRNGGSVKSFLNVTTDKVYKNNEWQWGYRENEELNGYDPYSNSKSCSELVTQTYKNCFLIPAGTAVSTARAGNVIGGGDFAANRIIPDCVKAASEHRSIAVRNPNSVRPYQHVLEPIYAYLLIAAGQYGNINLAGSYNVGPDEKDCIRTGELVDLFIKNWGENIKRINGNSNGPHEANFLKLDCSKLKGVFSWHPKWDVNTAVQKTVEWSKCYLLRGNIDECMNNQIEIFFRS